MNPQIGEIVAEIRKEVEFRNQAQGITSLQVTLTRWADKLEALGGWHDISTLPHTGEVVLFYIPGKRQCMNRADDFHSGMAHWLEGVTHWQFLPRPPNGMD